jgi:hypothetical protein
VFSLETGRHQRGADPEDAAAGTGHLLHRSRPDFPNGINLDRPFDLPAGIQRIDVQTGRATIVQ